MSIAAATIVAMLCPNAMGQGDCDGYPGVNLGDMAQLVCKIFMGCDLYPATGRDMLMPSNVRMWVIGHPDGANVSSASVYIETPIEINQIAIPYSYAAAPGQSDLTCTSVDFTESVANPHVGALIQDDDKLFVITSCGLPDPAIDANSNGLLRTAHFGLAGVAGTPVTVTPTSTNRYSALLIATQCYDGTDGERVFYPAFMPPPIGDCNCDRAIDIDDVVWLVEYTFADGPEPYDCY